MTQDATPVDQKQRNTEARWQSFTYVGVAFAIAAAVVGTVYFGGQAITRAHEEGTERIAECVEEGGSWVSTSSLCINDGQQ